MGQEGLMTSTFDFSEFPVLTTTRLHMRQLSVADSADIQRLFSDPRVLQYLNFAPFDTLDKAQGLIQWLTSLYDQQKGLQWALISRADGQFIGTSALHEWHRSDRHIELGYHILPEYWGQGYATEAAQALLRWAFEVLDVHRVQADCTDGHGASERVLLKCGFTLEGIWRESCWEHERFVNIRQFGLLRREYDAIRLK